MNLKKRPKKDKREPLECAKKNSSNDSGENIRNRHTEIMFLDNCATNHQCH